MEPPRDAASANARGKESNGQPVEKPSGGHHWSVQRRRVSRAHRLAAAALVLVLTGAVGYVGRERLHQHQKEVAAVQAIDAARKYALTLTNIDSNAIDRTVAEILDGSTGQFRDLCKKSSSQLRQLLIDNQAMTRGHVVEAAVKAASPNKVQVLLFIDQSVTNRASPKPQIDRSRIRMTMENVDGRWLVSKVELR
jgi:Mce-associated membrane protein